MKPLYSKDPCGMLPGGSHGAGGSRNGYGPDVLLIREDVKKIGRPAIPYCFKSKAGNDITICSLSEGDHGRLIHLYEEFEPKEGYQGLPPRLESIRQPWIQNLIRNNLNLLAMAGNLVVGHAALIPIPSSPIAEFLVFVHQDFQNQGIGTELTRVMAECAAGTGSTRLWLTVLTSNSRAVHVYQKCGFRFTGPLDSEREMVLNLESSENA